MICQSVGSSCDHKVVLCCPPSSGQGDRVVGIREFNVEVGNYLLGGSMDCQGNVSTRYRGE